jgi:hypothetical protein
MSNQESPSNTNASPVVKTTKTNSSSWVFGLAVVIIGGLLLAKNLGVELFFLDFHNWWAFFILAAAIQPLAQSWQIYKTEGFSHNMLNCLVSGSTIVFIALIFLLDLSLGTWWPSFIIIGGLYMMTSGKR